MNSCQRRGPPCEIQEFKMIKKHVCQKNVDLEAPLIWGLERTRRSNIRVPKSSTFFPLILVRLRSLPLATVRVGDRSSHPFGRLGPTLSVRSSRPEALLGDQSAALGGRRTRGVAPTESDRSFTLRWGAHRILGVLYGGLWTRSLWFWKGGGEGRPVHGASGLPGMERGVSAVLDGCGGGTRSDRAGTSETESPNWLCNNRSHLAAWV